MLKKGRRETHEVFVVNAMYNLIRVIIIMCVVVVINMLFECCCGAAHISCLIPQKTCPCIKYFVICPITQSRLISLLNVLNISQKKIQETLELLINVHWRIVVSLCHIFIENTCK